MTAACTGVIGNDGKANGKGGGSGGAANDPTVQAAAAEVGVDAMRRLSVNEYKQTVTDLLGISAEKASELLPVDTLAPFDNDYTLQTPDEALIKGADLLAGDLADAVVKDAAIRAQVTGCQPATPATDDACYRSFVTHFGRRALRRTLTPSEIDAFASLAQNGTTAGDFWVGVGAGLRAFLQHPEFLYRVQIGTPTADDPTVHQLSDSEVASRLSYLLIGSMPPDWLLDAADSGGLHTAEDITAAAQKLLDDPRARRRVDDFHAMWLSYSQLTTTGISAAMRAESDALVNRAVFDQKAPWVSVLTSTDTFVTPELAAHYGLASPGSGPGWVPYGDTGRKGILSHGSFLSAVSKFGDTSPTQRGLLVRARLFCQTISKPPPELKVNVDMPPGDPKQCKRQRYYMSDDPSCAGCHKLMDPIGFGLEAYDASGAFRSTEPNRPDCPIDGNGELVGGGTFNGPGQLADLVVQSGQVEGCVARQLYRFAVGRNALDKHDETILAGLVKTATQKDGLHFDQVILGYVGSKTFRFRRDEVTQ